MSKPSCNYLDSCSVKVLFNISPKARLCTIQIGLKILIYDIIGSGVYVKTIRLKKLFFGRYVFG